MITVAGWLVGVALARLAGRRTALLRAAVLAQAADLVTFAAMWEHAQGELNPLGALARHLASMMVGAGNGLVIPIAAVLLASLKLALIWYLLRTEAPLGRYRGPVLMLAAAAGAVGAASNVLAYPNSAGSLVILAAYALVAARWPMRFPAALGVGAGIGAAVLAALSGLAILSSRSAATHPYACAWMGCPPFLDEALTALGAGLVVAALAALWLTWRFPTRSLLRRPARAH